ncbi:hypothetical protein GCM10009647_033710 [Streptomyces sanglieri]
MSSRAPWHAGSVRASSASAAVAETEPGSSARLLAKKFPSLTTPGALTLAAPGTAPARGRSASYSEEHGPRAGEEGLGSAAQDARARGPPIRATFAQYEGNARGMPHHCSQGLPAAPG